MTKLNDVPFYQKCIKCHQLTDTENYTCTCGGEAWTKEYRMVDVNYWLSPVNRKRAINAFHRYHLDHPRGILQYFFTPHQEYMDNIDLRVGLTAFFPLKRLSEAYGTSIFLKNEGDNPSGCFKDRETVMAALHSMANDKTKAVIYSSGNAAASASLFAAQLGFQLITCVAGDTYPEKVEYIRKMGSAVIRIGNRWTSYEKGYRLFAQLNKEGFFTENDFDNWSVRNPYRVLGDKTTAIEIIKQYRQASGQQDGVPDYVIVSTGNGSCLAGIWKGFKELNRLGIIDRYPKMVSAAIKNASPVYKAFQKNMTHRPAVCNMEEVMDSDKEVGSTILAEEGYDSIQATKALIESGGMAMEVSKKEIKNTLIDLMEKEKSTALEYDLLPEPASLVTLAAIKKMQLTKDDSTVALISGHGAKAKDMLVKMLEKRPELQKSMHLIIQNRLTRQKNIYDGQKGALLKVKANVGDLKTAIIQLNKNFHVEDFLAV